MEEKRKLLWIDKDPTLYSSNYIGMFDLTKGIFMIEIILLHCINDYFSLNYYTGGNNLLLNLLLSPLTILRYGSVPMLFMICGYGVRRQSIGKNIKNNFKLFIFPYLCVILAVTVCVLVTWYLAGGSLASRLAKQVVPFFFGLHPGAHRLSGGVEQIGPVWFFLTYILSSIYLNLVLQERRSWVQILILGASIALALTFLEIPLPFCLPQTAICAGFMYVGMQLKSAKAPQQKLPVVPLILIYILCSLLTHFGGVAEIGNNIYVFSGLDLLTACLAGVILLCLHQKLNVLQGILADGLRWLGRHMMWLCCIHTVSYLMFPWDLLRACFADHQPVGLLLEILVSLVYAIGTCMLLETIVKRVLARKRKKRT